MASTPLANTAANLVLRLGVVAIVGSACAAISLAGDDPRPGDTAQPSETRDSAREVPPPIPARALAPAPPAIEERSAARELEAPDRPRLLKIQPIEPKPDDSELRKLLVARHNAAAAELAARDAIMQFGGPGASVGWGTPYLVDTVARLTKARLELAETSPQRVLIHEHHVEFLKAVEQTFEARYIEGGGNEIAVQYVRYLRLDAEIELLREKSRIEANQTETNPGRTLP